MGLSSEDMMMMMMMGRGGAMRGRRRREMEAERGLEDETGLIEEEILLVVGEESGGRFGGARGREEVEAGKANVAARLTARRRKSRGLVHIAEREARLLLLRLPCFTPDHTRR